jgi:hypothetical protein
MIHRTPWSTDVNRPPSRPRDLLVAFAYACLAAPALVGAVGSTEPRDGLASMFEDGRVNFAFRYRMEYVDQDAFANDAHASTLRSRLTFQSAEAGGFRFLVEADDIREVIWDDFNAGGGNTPNRTRYPIVADVAGTEINQAFVDYAFGTTTLRAGRQRILLDNQRFVGAVGWRQNEQTYDAVSVRHEMNGLTLFYAYVDTVRTIFGEQVAAGRHEQAGTHLINVSGRIGDIGRLTGYVYEFDNRDVPEHGTRTAGLRLTGSPTGVAWPVHYEAEAAWQRDAGDNPVSYRAHYLHVAGGFESRGWRATAGWERLSGDADRPGRAFRTPLATLHAFNGRTDKFLATPSAGLDDRYVRLQRSFGALGTELRFHRFAAEGGGTRFGRELSGALGYAFTPVLRGDVIAARFDGRGAFDDTVKAWLMLTASF